MSDTKWNLLVWCLGKVGLGSGHWMGAQGKKDSRTQGFMRVHRFFPSFLSIYQSCFLSGGPWGPPLPPFPSRAGPGKASVIVSPGLPWRVGCAAWGSQRWLLALTSGGW